MTEFVSPPYRLPGLLPSTAHPAGLTSRDTLFSSLGSSQDVRSTRFPFVSRFTNPSVCSRKPLFFLNFGKVDELSVEQLDVQNNW